MFMKNIFLKILYIIIGIIMLVILVGVIKFNFSDSHIILPDDSIVVKDSKQNTEIVDDLVIPQNDIKNKGISSNNEIKNDKLKEGENIACTMDAMLCHDGSYVGRTGPNCEFICPK